MMMMLLRIFIAGAVFLFVTILINAGASALKLTSWYTYLGDIGTVGIARAFSQLSIPSMLWLFVGYPLALGTLVYILRRLL